MGVISALADGLPIDESGTFFWSVGLFGFDGHLELVPLLVTEDDGCSR